MDDYRKYELECERIRQENSRLLTEFTIWLEKKQLTENTIRNHVQNIDFYINEFLLYKDAFEAKNGVSQVGEFLGYWFIKKAMWANVNQIKGNAASLKKLYTFMHEKGYIKQEDLDDLYEVIKEDMPEWIATMERYDDPSITDMGKVWGLSDPNDYE